MYGSVSRISKKNREGDSGTASHSTFSRELVDAAVEVKTASHLWEQQGVVVGFVLDNCGYKLMKRYGARSNKNLYLQTANHIAIELLTPPPSVVPPYKPIKDWPSVEQTANSLLLDLDGTKENSICMGCWRDLSLLAMTNKKVGVPQHHLGPAPRVEVLDPVNLSDRQNSSLGHVENLKEFVDMYKKYNNSVGLPLTLIWGDEQVWESIWRQQHQVQPM